MFVVPWERRWGEEMEEGEKERGSAEENEVTTEREVQEILSEEAGEKRKRQ